MFLGMTSSAQRMLTRAPRGVLRPSANGLVSLPLSLLDMLPPFKSVLGEHGVL